MTLLAVILIVAVVIPIVAFLLGAVASGRGASASDWPPKGWKR